MKWNIKVKTEGLTNEENEEIKTFIRSLKRKRKAKKGERTTFKIKMGEKTYVTR